jgi:hypothetical protein
VCGVALGRLTIDSVRVYFRITNAASFIMDAAFVISIKTRHDRTELQSPDQHAANSEASWFFCSVIGLSFFETAVSKWWTEFIQSTRVNR